MTVSPTARLDQKLFCQHSTNFIPAGCPGTPPHSAAPGAQHSGGGLHVQPCPRTSSPSSASPRHRARVAASKPRRLILSKPSHLSNTVALHWRSPHVAQWGRPAASDLTVPHRCPGAALVESTAQFGPCHTDTAVSTQTPPPCPTLDRALPASFTRGSATIHGSVAAAIHSANREHSSHVAAHPAPRQGTVLVSQLLNPVD